MQFVIYFLLIFFIYKDSTKLHNRGAKVYPGRVTFVISIIAIVLFFIAFGVNTRLEEKFFGTTGYLLPISLLINLLILPFLIPFLGYLFWRTKKIKEISLNKDQQPIPPSGSDKKLLFLAPLMFFIVIGILTLIIVSLCIIGKGC